MLNAFLVEDKADIRRTLVESMEELIPIKFIGQTSDEKSAAQWLAINEGRWDIAIIDLFLEKGSGFNVLKRCQPRNRRQKVIVLTSYRIANVIERCVSYGADRVFDKSEDVEKMVNYALEHLEYLQRTDLAAQGLRNALATQQRAKHIELVRSGVRSSIAGHTRQRY